MSLLKHTDHQWHCPYKGDASYFSIVADDRSVENAVWSYEKPFPAVGEIREYLAFYFFAAQMFAFDASRVAGC